MAHYSMCVCTNILASEIKAEPCPGMSAAMQAWHEDLGRKHVGRVAGSSEEIAVAQHFCLSPALGFAKGCSHLQLQLCFHFHPANNKQSLGTCRAVSALSLIHKHADAHLS